MNSRWVLPLHCDGRERGCEEEARFSRRPLQTWLVRGEDGELWPLLPPLGTVLPFNLLQMDIIVWTLWTVIIFYYLSLSSNLVYCAFVIGTNPYIAYSNCRICHLLTMPVLYNNQTIKLPFDISKLDNIYQPYIYTEYNVCDDTCESDLNDPFAKIFPDCKYHSANEFNTCNRNPNCLPGVYFIHLNARRLNLTSGKLRIISSL